MKKIIASITGFLISCTLFAQEALKTTEEEYYDFLALNGLAERPYINYRTMSDSRWTVMPDTIHPWSENNLGTTKLLYDPAPEESWYAPGINQHIACRIYGPQWFNSYNSTTPYGQNDGALWQGKGYNTSLNAGIALEGYGIEATMRPQFSFSQNREFDHRPGIYGSEYSYFWAGSIDLPQRFGDSSFHKLDMADTELRYTWGTFTTGLGTQHIWLGPAKLNPMLGSNNAPSYPKFDIGLRKTEVLLPNQYSLGHIEGRVWIGKLKESKYFDNDSTNDSRQITGFTAAYSPSFLPGLSIGGTKICINNWNNKSVKYLNPLYSTNDQIIQEDMKMAVFADWIFPQVGFEIYGEIGKDDHTTTLWVNPFHTVIYTVGARKSIALSKSGKIYGELFAEWNNFEMSQDFQLQWNYMGYYAHGAVTQGYTQDGQILGAGSGYFGNSQYLGFKVYYPKGSTKIFIHRNSPESNFNYNKAIGYTELYSKDENSMYDRYWTANKVVRTCGIETEYFVTKDFLINGGISSSWIMNPFSDKYKTFKRSERNIHGELGIKYNF